MSHAYRPAIRVACTWSVVAILLGLAGLTRPAEAQPPVPSFTPEATSLAVPIAHELVVAQDGSGDFTTISGAVDAAISGDTVVVRPGTYEETVIVDDDITVVGDDPSLVVVRPDPQGAACDSLGTITCAMAIVGADATVRSITFIGLDAAEGGAIALHVSGGDPQLEDLIVDGDVVIADASTVSVRYSDVSGGIMVSAARPAIRGNRIGWVRVEKGASPDIRRNRIGRLRLAGSGGLVRGNAIIGAGTDTAGPEGIGITVRRPRGNLDIRENLISRHRLGLSVAGGSALAIRYNNFERNQTGVWMNSVGDAKVRGNIFCRTQEKFRVRVGRIPMNLIERCGSGG